MADDGASAEVVPLVASAESGDGGGGGGGGGGGAGPAAPAAALAAAIARLAESPQLRRRLGCAGRARALALYAGAGAARGAVASQQRCAEGEAGGEGGEDDEGCAAESAVERFARVLHMAYAHGREMQELEARAAGS